MTARTMRSAVKPAPEAPNDGPDAVTLGPLPGYLGYMLRQAQAAVFRDFQRVMQGLDLTPGQFGLLTLVRANPGISQIALARIYRLDKSTLSPAIERLVQRDLVSRERAAADRRYYALALTRAGDSLLDEAERRVGDQERRMGEAVAGGPGKSTAEVPDLIEHLRRIAVALEPDS